MGEPPSWLLAAAGSPCLPCACSRITYPSAPRLRGLLSVCPVSPHGLPVGARVLGLGPALVQYSFILTNHITNPLSQCLILSSWWMFWCGHYSAQSRPLSTQPVPSAFFAETSELLTVPGIRPHSPCILSSPHVRPILRAHPADLPL